MSTINLFHGDCMQAMAEMPDKVYDLAIVDPPYGIGADNPAKKTVGIRQKNGTLLNRIVRTYPKKEWDQVPSDRYFYELKRVSKNQIVWGCNYFQVNLGPGRIVWDKLNGSSHQFDCEIAYQSFHYDTRIVRYLWQGMMQGLRASNSYREAYEQIGDKRKNESRIHPTQKPVILYKWLLNNYGNTGDKIIDTHGGSMSIAIACYDLGFDLDLWEKDYDFFAQGFSRFKKHTAQTRLFDPKNFKSKTKK